MITSETILKLFKLSIKHHDYDILDVCLDILGITNKEEFCQVLADSIEYETESGEPITDEQFLMFVKETLSKQYIA